MPPDSWVGYAFALTRSLKLLDGGSLGMSMQLPSASNCQPWYGQRSPHRPSPGVPGASVVPSLRPKYSDAPRCGQFSWIRPTLPLRSRNATRSSPSRRTLTGSPPGAATSLTSSAGVQ